MEDGYYEYKYVINDHLWISDPINKKANMLDQYNSVISVKNNYLSVFNQKIDNKNIPQIIYPDETYSIVWNNLYEGIWDRIQIGNPINSFSEYYYDEAKDDCIYQWDSCFAELFLMFGNNIFPAMSSIDNFYRIQKSDGYIPRLLKSIDGKPTGEYRKNNPLINPPLFSYVELEYAKITGNISRLYKVHENLDKYFHWLEDNMSLENNRNLYYNTLLGSGMDTLPRNILNKKSCWVDMSSQQALSALTLSKIYKIISNNEKSVYYNDKYENIKKAINENCWSNENGFYYDLLETGSLLNKQTVAGLWTLLAKIPDINQVNLLVEKIMNPNKFFRKNVIPTLPADDQDYSSTGWYWKGGVWSNINYIIIAGLKKYKRFDLAYVLSQRNIKNIIDVFFSFNPEFNKISPNEKNFTTHTFWEAYSPDYPKPALRWDNNYYCKPNFLLWSALSIINLFINNILGFSFSGFKKRIKLNIFEIDERYRGIDNFYFLNNPVMIKYNIVNNKIHIFYEVLEEINLILYYHNKSYEFLLTPENKQIEIPII